MESSALLYSPIFCLSVGPVIRVTITMMASRTVPRQRSPIRQSNRNISTASPSMVAYMPALSGSWCARYVSVDWVDSCTHLRTFPLPSVSRKPIGRLMICCIRVFRIFAAIRNAATWEHINPPKYTTMDAMANATAIQP